jgi:hypothetical protein
VAEPGIFGADLLMRVGVDASGAAAQLSSQLTGAERQAVLSGERIGGSLTAASSRATEAQLRYVAATEKANLTLATEGVTAGRVAAAQASQVAALRRLTAAQAAQTAEQNASAASSERLAAAGTSSSLGSAKHLVSLGLFFGGAEALKTGIDVLKQYQGNLAQTRAALASTGGVANVTSEHIQKLGEEIQNYSGQSREAIIHAANLELTFTNLRDQAGKGNDVFDRATKALADLSARGFGTAETNAKALGRALQDPISGLTLLRRSGITFTKDQQDTVKSLAAQNRLLDAQKFILDVINQKVGGSARAFGQTLPGEIDRTKNSLEDVERTVLGATEPVIKVIATATSFLGGHQLTRDLLTGLVATTAALAVVNKGVKFFGEVSDNVFRRNAEKAASNELVADSLRHIAVAGNEAAAAEERVAVAGGASGAGAAEAGGAGLLARFGPKALAGLSVTAIGATAGITIAAAVSSRNREQAQQKSVADSIATPAELEAAKQRVKQIEEIAQRAGGAPQLFVEHKELVNAIAAAEPRIKAQARRTGEAAGKSAGDGFAAAFKASTAAVSFADIALGSGGQRSDNIKSARQQLRDAIQAEQDAAAAVNKARAGTTTTTAGTKPATPTDLRVAELRVQAAQANARKNGTTSSEEATLLAAEQRLNDLRNQGHGTVTKTKVAEDQVAGAIRSQVAAQKAVNAARKALDKAHGLSAQDVLKSIHGDAASAKQLASDTRRLAATGATQEELTNLKALDLQNPGTLHRIAQLGTAQERAFNDAYTRALVQQGHAKKVAEMGYDGAVTVAKRKAVLQATAWAKAYQREVARRMKGFDPTKGGAPFQVPSALPPGATLPGKVTSAGYLAP